MKNLFDFAAEKAKGRLIRDLIKTTPFNPRLANKLYSLSNFGLQEKYISKFSGARSIQQATLTDWKNEKDVLDSVGRVEAMNSLHISHKERSQYLSDLLVSSNTCIIGTIQELRDTM